MAGDNAPDLALRIDSTFVKAAWGAFGGARVGSGNAEIGAELEALAKDLRASFIERELTSNLMVREVRAMFSAAGTEPSRYKPASEALLRRIVKGDTPPRINDAVDLNNLVSLETLVPCGIYDLAKLAAPLVMRGGAAGESYASLGKGVLALEGKLCLADTAGPFGSPISDSRRAAIEPGERDLLFVMYAPPSALDGFLRFQLDQLRRRVESWLGGRTLSSGVAAPAVGA